MLHEIIVRNLGVIEQASLVLRPGLTALTGETGAGKTLVTEALALLSGGRADPSLVRAGAAEAEVEGRFVVTAPGEANTNGGAEEIVIRRVIPADGRSRAYIDGRLATATAIAESVGDQIDLHGQHGQQSLLRGPSRRAALDQFAGIDAAPLAEARHRLRQATSELHELGGDDRARVREIELLRFQLTELDAAGITNADEDDELLSLERLLGDASSHREAGIGASSILGSDGVVGDGLARALGLLKDREIFADAVERVQSLIAESADLADTLRATAEVIADDPARLAAVGERRRVLAELRRKYGASLAEVIAYHTEVSERLESLESFDERTADLRSRIEDLGAVVQSEATKLGAKRRKAAPRLAAQVQERLRSLALAEAVVEVTVGDDPGDDVDFLVSMNPGSPPSPIARVASGGELSRVMLSLQMVVADAPPTIVFDEVDAGVGGTAATAVGSALGGVAVGRQVLVVTHLAQVAAFADHHIHISKQVSQSSSVTTLTPLDEAARIVELSRMLSGSPDSETAQRHAAELLSEAAAGRQGPR